MLHKGFKLLLESLDIIRAFEGGIKSKERDNGICAHPGQPLIGSFEMADRL